MSETFPFVEQVNSAFVFRPTLDGDSYTAYVTWNISGLRYYVSLYQPDGTRVVTLPLIGSPNAFDIQSITWENGTVTLQTRDPHRLPVASTVDLAVRGCSPDAYNGKGIQMLVTGVDTLTYLLQANPGTATELGTVAHDVDITGGYFQTSSLVFRQDSQQFETYP